MFEINHFFEDRLDLNVEKSIFSTAFAAGAAAEDFGRFLSESKDFIVGRAVRHGSPGVCK